MKRATENQDMKARCIRCTRHLAALLGCLAIGLSPNALAGDFSINPIRIFLSKDRKADVVTVRNNGTVPLQFEIRPREWTQAPSGEDVYVDTRDLLVFPRLMVLKGGEDRDIRIGMRIPPGATEKTYRVYINELPPTVNPEDADGPSANANVGFLINFALPVFFAPLEPAPALQVTHFDLSGGRIDVKLANTGNTHLFVEEMVLIGSDASGAEVYRKAIPERYVLAGTTRSYEENIPTQDCAALAAVVFSVRTDKTIADAKKEIDNHSCGSAIPGTPAPDSAR